MKDHKKNHRMRSYHWIRGILSHRDTYHTDLQEALAYIANLSCDGYKVFDPKDQMIYSSSRPDQLYA